MEQGDEDVGSQDQDRWQDQAPGLLPRREGGRMQVRRASRPRQQARELSSARGAEAGGEASAKGNSCLEAQTR